MYISKSHQLLHMLFYIVLFLTIGTLIVSMIHEDNGNAVSLSILQSGELPPEAENITPLPEDGKAVPGNVKNGDVFFGIDKELSASTDGIIWNLTNPQNSEFSIHVELLNEDNLRLASSGLIPPGYYMECAPIMEKLPSGQISCTAYILAYEQKSGAYYGGFLLPVTVYST